MLSEMFYDPTETIVPSRFSFFFFFFRHEFLEMTKIHGVDFSARVPCTLRSPQSQPHSHLYNVSAWRVVFLLPPHSLPVHQVVSGFFLCIHMGVRRQMVHTCSKAHRCLGLTCVGGWECFPLFVSSHLSTTESRGAEYRGAYRALQ